MKIPLIITCHNRNDKDPRVIMGPLAETLIEYDIVELIETTKNNNKNIDFYTILCSTKSIDVNYYQKYFDMVMVIDNDGHKQGEKHLMDIGFGIAFSFPTEYVVKMSYRHPLLNIEKHFEKVIDEKIDLLSEHYWCNEREYSSRVFITNNKIVLPWRNMKPILTEKEWINDGVRFEGKFYNIIKDIGIKAGVCSEFGLPDMRRKGSDE